jgi:MutS domain V
MNVRLLHPDRDLDPKGALPAHADAIVRDLDLRILFDAMAGDDRFLREVVVRGVLNGAEDPVLVHRRLAALGDVRENRAVVRELYDTAVTTLERERTFWGLGNYPESVLRRGLELLVLHSEALARLRQVASAGGQTFRSEAFLELFRRLLAELPDPYLERVRDEIDQLHFPGGLWISARLGRDGRSVDYALRRPSAPRVGWWRRWFGARRSPLVFEIAEHDESGARALSDFRERGLASAASAVARSNDHLSAFFLTLRAELGFFLACLNLERALADRGYSVHAPEPLPAADRAWSATGLYDPCLALRTALPVVSNDLGADGRSLVVVTGANQGGKSTFLRSVGVAQLLMHAGMFVPARTYRASVASIVLTHFAREEDPSLTSGRFDGELERMEASARWMRPNGMLLANEPFASTNEREGSEIAYGVVRAFRESGVRVLTVTHLFEFAQRLAAEGGDEVLFLRAERDPEGGRTFRILPSPPLATSFAADVYREVFGVIPRGAVG